MKKIAVTTLLIFISVTIQGQCAYNREWFSSNASPDTIDLTSSTVDSFGHTFMTGNTKVVGQGNNFITVKYDADGILLWQQQFNGSANGNDYGSAIAMDASGNVYVTGTTYSGTAQGYNYMTIKYNAAGNQLWTVQYNGPGNGYDVTAGIALDNSGNIYITGASAGTGSPLNLDYATIKYNSNGVQQWVSRYNYMGLPDLAVGLVLDNNNNVFVTGASASSIFNSDMTTIKYNSSGTQVAINRYSVTGNGWDKSTSIKKDNSGNLFISGGTFQSLTTSNTRTLKYNNSLSLQWAKTFDGEGLDDVANTLDVDLFGNVFIAGFVKKQNGGKDYLTIKYDVSGNEIWARRQSATVPTSFGEVHRLIADNSGGVVVTGEMTNAGNKDYLTIMYDANGLKMWENFFNAPSNGTDRALNINMSGSDVIVSGKTAIGTSQQYTTVKYSTLPTSFTVDSTGGVYHAANQVVVQFDPSVLNMANVDNKSIQFGLVQDFVNSTCISKMNSKLGLDVSKWQLVKVYPWLSSADSISISRQGDTIIIPKFYATFVLYTAGIADSTATDSLNTTQPYVWRAELNYLYKMSALPNDPQLANQNSYYASPSYPSAGINLYPAWNFATGKSFVRVGVFDTGIDQTHPDLSGAVAGGYNFLSGTNLSQPYDNEGHGTLCSGIIGARSNNSTGIAGIAGGDNTALTGVALYDMKIGDLSGFATLTTISNAMVTGATSISGGGMELWVMSHSWGGLSNAMELNDAVRYSNHNGVIFIAARGNFPGNGATTNHDVVYPSCLQDETVINVGGTGADGNWKTTNNGNPFDQADMQGESMIQHGVDVVAPATNLVVLSTQTNTGSYVGFNGTSASTPHVAGVAALMASYYDANYPTQTNLANEDVENILQMTATDLTASPQSGGYDDYSGFGKMDGGFALAAIEQPYYKIHHFGQNATNLIVPTLIAQNAVVFFEPYQSLAGYYIVDIYSSTHTLNYTLGSNEQILGYWPRFSATTGWPFTSVLGSGDNSCTIISLSSTQAIVKTYMYHVISDISGTQIINQNFPAPSYQLKVGISIYTHDPTAVGMEQQNPNSGISLGNPFPNPANDAVNFTYNLTQQNSVRFEVFDVAGQLVKSITEKEESSGLHTETIPIEDLANGVYFLQLTTESGIITKKFMVCR